MRFDCHLDLAGLGRPGGVNGKCSRRIRRQGDSGL